MRILDPIMKGTDKDDDSSSGNVTTVVSDRKVPYFHSSTGDLVYFSPDIASAQDYYPFGSIMPGRSFSSGYRFGFNGKEQDGEVKGDGNSVNYKYWVHDPRLGRFLGIDPLAPKYPFYSPYAFSGNRVIDAVELEGLEPWLTFAWMMRPYGSNAGGDLTDNPDWAAREIPRYPNNEEDDDYWKSIWEAPQPGQVQILMSGNGFNSTNFPSSPNPHDGQMEMHILQDLMIELLQNSMLEYIEKE